MLACIHWQVEWRVAGQFSKPPFSHGTFCCIFLWKQCISHRSSHSLQRAFVQVTLSSVVIWITHFPKPQVSDSYPPSLPDFSIPTDADSFVFLRPNFLSFFAHSDWMKSCCPVLKTTFSAWYPFSYTLSPLQKQVSLSSIAFRINHYAKPRVFDYGDLKIFGQRLIVSISEPWQGTPRFSK